jgi:hypothetical protein
VCIGLALEHSFASTTFCNLEHCILDINATAICVPRQINLGDQGYLGDSFGLSDLSGLGESMEKIVLQEVSGDQNLNAGNTGNY